MNDPKDARITQQVNNKLASRGFLFALPFDGADSEGPGDPFGSCSVRPPEKCGRKRH
jgi:hypothetical protein